LPAQLTAPAVQRLKATSKRREIRDGGCRGLILVIQPSGHKSWVMRFTNRAGHLRRMSLGPVDITGKESDTKPTAGVPLTLAAARQLAAEINRERARGNDPIAVSHRAKLERKARGDGTFATAARDFIEQHAKRKTRRWPEQARLLGLQPTDQGGLTVIRGGLADRWVDRAIAEIDGDDIHHVIEEVREKGAPGLERRAKRPTESRARSMYATLSKLFGWLIAKRRLRQNPCMGVARPETPKARERVLTNGELVKLWKACDQQGYPFGPLVKMLVLTAARLNEVAGMRRTEVSESDLTWTIPGERTKNHRTHVLPLSPMAADILRGIQYDNLIFSTNGTTPISGWSKVKNRFDAATGIAKWTFHDIRRSAATHMAEIGVQPHIIEEILNHISGHKAGVAGIYNRAAYSGEKRAALERWANHIEGLLTGKAAKVINLRERK